MKTHKQDDHVFLFSLFHLFFFLLFRSLSMRSLRFLFSLPAVQAFSSIPLPPARSFALFSTAATDTAGMTTTTSNPTLPTVAPNAKRIFWVRHGEVVNPGGPGRSVYYGAQDVPLSPLGELEAQAAAQSLAEFGEMSLVASSPLQRAVYGAQQVVLRQQTGTKKQPRMKVTQLEGFCELDRGAWCGKTKAEIGPDNLARFDACDESVTPAGGESYPELKARVLAARDQVLDLLQPGEMGCVVSHLQVTRSVLSDALDIPTSEMAQLPIATASVTCIDYYQDEKEGPTVHFQSFKPDVGLEKAKDGAN